MKTAFAALLLTCLSALALADEKAIGFQESTLPDTQNGRVLKMVVWYPTTTTATPQLIAADVVFVGAAAVPNAPPVAGEHPLVVLSHGYRGNWHNEAWLASALAHQGYIVAAVNHPGSTTHDLNAKAAAQLWQRPVDVSRVIDAISAQPEKYGVLTKGRIAVVGHSLGGWTALEIAGARFDPALFAEDCKAHPQLSSCSVYKQMNPANSAELKAALSGDLRDKRVTAVVTLDLGLSRGLTDQSLAALSVPVLVIAAGVPSQDLPAELESANLAKRLPGASSQYVEISDASHFSFIAMCKPGARELLEEDVPGDGVICLDGDGGRERGVIQGEIAGRIGAFLGWSSVKN